MNTQKKCEYCRAKSDIQKWTLEAKGFRCPVCNHLEKQDNF